MTETQYLAKDVVNNPIHDCMFALLNNFVVVLCFHLGFEVIIFPFVVLMIMAFIMEVVVMK